MIYKNIITNAGHCLYSVMIKEFIARPCEIIYIVLICDTSTNKVDVTGT